MPQRILSLVACIMLSACIGGGAALEGPGPDAFGGPPFSAVAADQDTALAYNGFASGWPDCWQSFTAGRTGSLVAVRVWAALPSNVTLTLYEGEGTSGAVLANTTSMIDLGDSRWEAAFPDVNVTESGRYTVRLGAESDLNWIVGTYDYAGGMNNVYGTGADFGITTFVGEPAVVTPSGPVGSSTPASTIARVR